MDGKLNKQNFDHTHVHPPLLKKKNVRSLGSAFCSDIFSFKFSLRQHGLGCQLQMAFEFKHAHVRHLLWLSIFFYNHTILFGTAPEASLHGVECPALCVCVGVQHYKYGGRRENEHVKRMHCRSLSFPFLFSICLFFLHRASLSVFSSMYVHTYTCISGLCPPDPHIFLAIPPSCHNGTAVG